MVLTKQVKIIIIYFVEILYFLFLRTKNYFLFYDKRYI